MTDASGTALVLVATPIGNLEDISERAIRDLRKADAIACEDTRRTGRLLAHFSIAHGPLIVCNEHTEADAAAEIVRRLRRGDRVALVSDAGMPSVSDPGVRVVRAAIDAGFDVTAVPGPSAVTMALALSGFEAARFVFEGFLPRKGRARSGRIADLVAERRTTVLYEAPHRLRRTVYELAEAMGPDRRIALARELTKRFEEVWRGTLADAIDHVEAREPRGEYVIVVAGAEPTPVDDDALVEALRDRRGAGATARDAIDAVTAEFGVPRRRVYDLAIAHPVD